MNWNRTRRLRQAVQAFAFILFISLLFAPVTDKASQPAVDLFFRLNPLTALAGMLAGRNWIPRLGLALVTICLTLLAGRAWCGWICPLGTLLDWIGPAPAVSRRRKRRSEPPPAWREVKILLLIAILGGAILRSLTLLAFDPLALLTRTLTVAVLPALNYLVTALERILYPVSFLEPALDWVESVLRGVILPVKQPFYSQNILIALLFTAILGLNVLASRFWCRYLCPLGGLLSLISRFAPVRLEAGPACTGCTRCALACPQGAIAVERSVVTPDLIGNNMDPQAVGRPEIEIQPATENTENTKQAVRRTAQVTIIQSECTLCMDCLASCKKNDLRFRTVLTPLLRQEPDPSRRAALATLAASMGALLLMRTGLKAQQPEADLLRPPGAQDEAVFLSTCVRCSQCMHACPTNALQPAALQAGLEAVWTPVLTPRTGYCDYGCTTCGRVCPSGAIPLLSLDEKRQVVLGKASLNRDRCLPWSSATACIICEEMCPTPQKSIRLEEAQVQDAGGNLITVQRPVVVRELCIGCGICENRCPIPGEAGIRIYRSVS